MHARLLALHRWMGKQHKLSRFFRVIVQPQDYPPQEEEPHVGGTTGGVRGQVVDKDGGGGGGGGVGIRDHNPSAHNNTREPLLGAMLGMVESLETASATPSLQSIHRAGDNRFACPPTALDGRPLRHVSVRTSPSLVLRDASFAEVNGRYYRTTPQSFANLATGLEVWTDDDDDTAPATGAAQRSRWWVGRRPACRYYFLDVIDRTPPAACQAVDSTAAGSHGNNYSAPVGRWTVVGDTQLRAVRARLSASAASRLRADAGELLPIADPDNLVCAVNRPPACTYHAGTVVRGLQPNQVKSLRHKAFETWFVHTCFNA